MEESKNEEKMDAVVKAEDTDVKEDTVEDGATNDAHDVAKSNGEATKKDDVANESVIKEEGEEEANGEVKTEEEEPSSKKKRKGKSSTTEEGVASKRERRERKSVETFDPNAFPVGKYTRNIVRIDGRGTRLADLAPCVRAMEAHAQHLPVAYRLVYKPKALKKKEMMQDLLEFNGYLPKKDASLNETEQEERDDEVEAKFGAKAYKLTSVQVKALCDFFGVDRRSLSSKDDLVDQLLDFLSEPNAELLIGTTTKKGVGGGGAKKGKKKKGKRKAKNDDEEDGDDDMEEDVVDKDDPDYDDVDDDKLKVEEDAKSSNKMPNEDKLRKWVRAYVRCFHETKLTVNHALEIASEKFGVDLTPKKADLRKLLIDEL